jgi:polar amino acid transport system substrate-binding protein
LEAGKQVFVEKPLVVTERQLEALCGAYEKANTRRPTGLMVGLNRRFAPMVGQIKEAFSAHGAKQLIYRVNSGHIPTSTWLHEADEGAGMLIGEMCHFVDLMQFICAERPVSVYARSMAVNNHMTADHDNLVLVISFDGGSVGTLNYNTVGNKTAPKERLEVFGGGLVAVLDDFRSLELIRENKQSRTKAANQDKGQAREVAETVEGFRKTGMAPIPFDEMVAGMKVIFAARESLASGQPVSVGQQIRYEVAV